MSRYLQGHTVSTGDLGLDAGNAAISCIAPAFDASARGMLYFDIFEKIRSFMQII